jgi:beta-galactosidase
VKVLPIDNIFPFGIHLYREPSRPLNELIHDMHVLKALGFNMLKLQESWSYDERKEGNIDLNKVETLIEEAEKLGLYIYFGVTMEQAPAWFWKKYPDCGMVYSTGETHKDSTQYLLPGDGKPGPCWDHPGTQESGTRFISEITRRLSRYENISVWNIWQEIGFWPMRSIPNSLGLCYCSYTLESFRQWLQGKYGDLDSLNKTWRTGYGDWSEVEPPRIFPMVPSYIDWRYFIDDIYLARVLRLKARSFRINDPKKRPIFCHVSSPTIGRGSEWRWAKETDIFGSSCYPSWFPFHKWDANYPKAGQSISQEISLLKETQYITMNFDYVRSASGPNQQIWAAEFQGGPISLSLHKGRDPSREDIRRWILAALSSGIRGLSFWNHRAEIFWAEAYGFGLLDSQGDKSSRIQEAGRLSNAINRYAYLFKDGQVSKRQVAILINENQWHFTQATSNDASSHLTFTIQGIYNILWDAGIWIDFVEIKETTIKELKKYKVLILPFPLALSVDVNNLLKEYVASGGTLVSEACPGRYSHFGFTHPGELASEAKELFGVEHKAIKMCHEPIQPPRWTPVERSYGEILQSTRLKGTGQFAGHSILPSLYIQTFNVKGSKPILLNSENVTGVVNNFDKGHAYIIGTFLGHAYKAFEDKETALFLLTVLKKAGVKPECFGRLCFRQRIKDDSKAWFFFNMTKNSISQKIRVGNFSHIKDILGKSLPSRSGVLSLKVDPFTIRCLITDL